MAGAPGFVIASIGHRGRVAPLSLGHVEEPRWIRLRARTLVRERYSIASSPAYDRNTSRCSVIARSIMTGGGGHDLGDARRGAEHQDTSGCDHRLQWELYNVREDPTQFNDLAAMPDKVKQMRDLFYAEAKKYNVLPLDDPTLVRWNTSRPSRTAGRAVFAYSGEVTGVPASAAPNILDKSYIITVEVEIPERGAEGMIVTKGGRFGGYGLFLSKANSASAGASWCSSITCSTSSARFGKGPSWKPASTPSSLTSRLTARARAREERACCPWTARKWPKITSNMPPRLHSPRTNPLISARTPAPGSHCWNIATILRSNSPVRSTS